MVIYPGMVSDLSDDAHVELFARVWPRGMLPTLRSLLYASDIGLDPIEIRDVVLSEDGFERYLNMRAGAPMRGLQFLAEFLLSAPQPVGTHPSEFVEVTGYGFRVASR